MKNLNLWNVYAGLTVLATLVLGYLKIIEKIPISWVWITAPVWGSLLLGFALVGVMFCLVWYFGDIKNLRNDKKINNKV